MSDFASPDPSGDAAALSRGLRREVRIKTLRQMVAEKIDVKTSTLALMDIRRELEDIGVDPLNF